jgi:serine/threonine protein kinase
LLLLKDEYKNLLLEQGIEDIKTFLKRHQPNTHYLIGRTPHPSIPLRNGESMVIRFYSHGGLFRPFTRNLYCFGARSFRELALTEEIRSSDIPTIQPIGAIHRFMFPPFYQAYFLSLLVPHAIDLIQYFQEIGLHPSPKNLSSKRKTIRSLGLLLQQFHQAGFVHGDLQLKNILLANGQLLLIDFDKTYRKPVLSVTDKMKNLLRLNRSVEKWKRLGLSITRTDRLRFFLAYAGDNHSIYKVMERHLRTHSLRLLFHRFGWALQKIFRSDLFGVARSNI